MRGFIMLSVMLCMFSHAAATDLGRQRIAGILLPLARQCLHQDPSDPKGLLYLQTLQLLAPEHGHVLALTTQLKNEKAIGKPELMIDPITVAQLLTQQADEIIKNEFKVNIEAGKVARLYLLCAESILPADMKTMERLAYLRAFGLQRPLDDLLKSPPDFEKAGTAGTVPKNLTLPISKVDRSVGEAALHCAAGLLVKDTTSQEGITLIQLGLYLNPGDPTGHLAFLCLSRGLPVAPPKRDISIKTMITGLLRRYQTLISDKNISPIDQYLARLYLATLNSIAPSDSNVVLAVAKYERKAPLPEMNDVASVPFNTILDDVTAQKYKIDQVIQDVLPEKLKTNLDRSEIRQQLIDLVGRKEKIKYPLPFSLRDPSQRKMAYSLIRDEIKSIDTALKWLAAQQEINGSFVSPPRPDSKITKPSAHAAARMTANTVHPFLIANQTPASSRYGYQVTKALIHLADFVMRPEADILLPNYLRSSQSVSIEILAEAFAMTRLEFCRTTAIKGLKHILKEQNPDGSFGAPWSAGLLADRLKTMLIAQHSGINSEGLAPAIEKGLKFFGDNIHTPKGYLSKADAKPSLYEVDDFALPLLLSGPKHGALLEVTGILDHYTNYLRKFTTRKSTEEFKQRFNPDTYYPAVLAQRHQDPKQWHKQRKTIAQRIKNIQDKGGFWNNHMNIKDKSVYYPALEKTASAVMILQAAFSYHFEP